MCEGMGRPADGAAAGGCGGGAIGSCEGEVDEKKVEEGEDGAVEEDEKSEKFDADYDGEPVGRSAMHGQANIKRSQRGMIGVENEYVGSSTVEQICRRGGRRKESRRKSNDFAEEGTFPVTGNGRW